MEKNKIPKATHSGILEIGEIKIQCYVLEDRTRVISQGGMGKALGKSRGRDLAVFLTRKGLKPFISKQLLDDIKKPRLFIPPHGGKPGYAYKATVLADICEAVLKCRAEGKLKAQLKHIATQCEILVRAFMKVGIIALVDDATEFSKLKSEYRQLFKEFIRDEAGKWEKQFPDDIYDIFYKIYELPRSENKNKHPLFFANLTRKYIYEPLAGSNGGLLKMLDEKNPILISNSGKKKRKFKFHQFLEKIGINTLQQHMWQLIGIGKASSNKNSFNRNFNRTFSKNYQFHLFDEDEE
jgi:hypothetical protein